MAKNQDNNKCSSVAIWYTAKSDATPDAKVTLHFNLWYYGRTSFLDMGIMIENHSCIKDLSIFMPISLDIEDIEDLGEKFKEEDTSVGIFNEPVFPAVETHYVTLKKGNRSYTRIFFLQFEKDTEEIDIKKENGNTIITITKNAFTSALNGIKVKESIYFRIRIPLPIKNNPFVQELKPTDKGCSTGYEAYRCFDFRLNDQRNLPLSIIRKSEHDNNISPSIVGVHFLLVSEVQSDFAGGYSNFNKCRMLEKNIWDKYVSGKESLKNDMIIYHWKREPESKNEIINDFNVFMKFRIRKSNFWTIFIGIIVVFTIGVVSSCSANYLSEMKNEELPFVDKSTNSSDKLEKKVHDENVTNNDKPLGYVGNNIKRGN